MDPLSCLNLNNVQDDLTRFHLSLNIETGDVPMGTLCLPNDVLSILRREGYTRVKDLLGIKLEAINGIGRKRAGILSSKLRVFFSYDL